MSGTWESFADSLRAIPSLPDALCIGRYELFDEPDKNEDPDDVTYRHERAVALCEACPELDHCGAWLAGLKPKAVTGVIAGEIRNPPKPYPRRRQRLDTDRSTP